MLKLLKVRIYDTIKSVFNYLHLWFHLFIWSKTPWWNAYVRAAWKKYTETTLYRDRVVLMGEEFAFDSYFGDNTSNGETDHFHDKVKKDKALMLKIIFTPYSVDVI